MSAGRVQGGSACAYRREAGSELARQGHVPDELLARLRRPVIEWAGVTREQYVDTGNEMFRRAVEAARQRTQQPK